MTTIGVEYGMKLTLTGPDGTKAVFNDDTDENYVGILDPNESSGLDSPDEREDAADKVEGDGGIHGDFYAGRRPVILAGIIRASTVTQRNERAEKLRRASGARRADATITFTPTGGEAVELKVRRNQPLRITGAFVKKFQVPLVAADPRIYATATKESTVAAEGSFITTPEEPPDVAVDATYIYWADYKKGTIGRAKLDGSAPNGEFITTPEAPYGVAVDATYIYWADYKKGTIGRAKLDGSSPNAEFITTPEGPLGVAVDSTYIYWTDGTKKTIGRAKLDGSSPNGEFITLPEGAHGVAVDATYIYWAVFNEGIIGRAKLDGSAPNGEFITAPEEPFGVAVDATYIYWADYKKSAIGRAKLDGSSPNAEFITTPEGPEGVVVDSTYIYWADYKKGTIGRLANQSVTNGGDAETPPILKLYGPAENPTFKNVTTGESMSMTYTLAEGHYIEINMKNATAMLDGVTDLSQYVDFPAEWWFLDPGANELEVTASSKAIIEYHNAWM